MPAIRSPAWLYFPVPSPLDECRPLFSPRFVVDETKRSVEVCQMDDRQANRDP